MMRVEGVGGKVVPLSTNNTIGNFVEQGQF